MKFTEAEKRYLAQEHRELRMPELLPVDWFIANQCPPAMAERIVQGALEKRARQLGPAFEEVRRRLAAKTDEFSVAPTDKFSTAVGSL